jgi:hypothetical protein
MWSSVSCLVLKKAGMIEYLSLLLIKAEETEVAESTAEERS